MAVRVRQPAPLLSMDLPLQWSGALRGVLIGHQLAHRHRVRDLRRECLRRELRRHNY